MRIAEVASAIKSANAGASQITIDIVFADWDTYELVAAERWPDPSVVAGLYRVDPDEVRVHHYRPARTVKVTIPRAVVSGGVDERDFDGVQQYVPILDLELDIPGI